MTLLVVACGGRPKGAAAPAQEPTAVASPAADDKTGAADDETGAAPADDGRAGCRRGEVRACDALADYWGERQIASSVDSAQARQDAAILHRACDEEGISSACMGLAFMYKYGSATGEADKSTSNQYWARVAELGDLNGYRGKPVSDDGKKVLAETERECEDGRARACAQLGWAAYSGVMQDRSPKRSYDGYRKGCVRGDGQACRWAGHLVRAYRLGSKAQSRAHLERGCRELHSLAACTELGHFTEDVLEQPDNAKLLYEPACAAGNREACFSLALTLDGEGADPKRVTKLYLVACEAGEDQSCASLAKHFGEGCALDLDLGGDADLGARALGAVRAYCAGAEPAPGCENAKACR